MKIVLLVLLLITVKLIGSQLPDDEESSDSDLKVDLESTTQSLTQTNGQSFYKQRMAKSINQVN